MASRLTLPGPCVWCPAPAVVVAVQGRLCASCGARVVEQRRQTEAVRVCAPNRCYCGVCPTGWTQLPPAGWRQPPTDSYARRRAELREGRRAA